MLPDPEGVPHHLLLPVPGRWNPDRPFRFDEEQGVVLPDYGSIGECVFLLLLTLGCWQSILLVQKFWRYQRTEGVSGCYQEVKEQG